MNLKVYIISEPKDVLNVNVRWTVEGRPTKCKLNKKSPRSGDFKLNLDWISDANNGLYAISNPNSFFFLKLKK